MRQKILAPETLKSQRCCVLILRHPELVSRMRNALSVDFTPQESRSSERSEFLSSSVGNSQNYPPVDKITHTTTHVFTHITHITHWEARSQHTNMIDEKGASKYSVGW